jgi:hypothetical protein
MRSCRDCRRDADKLEDAINKLAASLDPALRIDGNHIVDKDGNSVFDLERGLALRPASTRLAEESG